MKKQSGYMTSNDELDLADLTTEDLNRITRSVKKAKQGRPYKYPGKKFEVYLKPDWAEHLEVCMRYAKQKHMIKAETKYAFGSWAIEQVISTILSDIRLSKRNSDLNDNQT